MSWHFTNFSFPLVFSSMQRQPVLISSMQFPGALKGGLEPSSRFSKVLKSKLHGKCKETSIPRGMKKRDVWGPILFKYCRVRYSNETRKLEIMKGDFVGKCKPTRPVTLVEGLKCKDDASHEDDDDKKPLSCDERLKYDSSKDDDDDSDEVHNSNDGVDDDDGQVPVDVVAEDILPGLCFLF